MFFKKKETKQPTQIKCEVNNNLTECDSVGKIRLYQNELDKINADSSIYAIFNKHLFNIREINRYDETRYYNLKCELSSIMDRCKINKISCEEYFSKLGKDLDDYNNKDIHIKELKEKIDVDKEKLGIKY